MARKPKKQPVLERMTFQLDRDRQLEIAGLLLITVGGLTVLSLMSITGGAVTSRWADLLRRVFGWGAYPLGIGLVAAGLLVLLHVLHTPIEIAWSRVIAAEVLFFSLLALLHLFSGSAEPIELADRGGGGGYVGWALSLTLSDAIGSFATAGLLGLAAVGSLWVILEPLLRPIQRLLAEAASSWAERQTAAAVISESPQPAVPPMEEIETTTSPAPRRRTPTATARRKRVRTTVRSRAEELSRDGLPPLDLLDKPSRKGKKPDIRYMRDLIEKTLASFGVPVEVVEVNEGPTITQFALEPGFVERRGSDGQMKLRKIRVSRITALANDLALALSASPIRIEAPVPGRPFVGLEVPNPEVSLVNLREVMGSEAFQFMDSPLKLALGKGTSGEPVAANLATMPHLLIAGATGSGKSVCINSIVACLLFENGPEDLKFILVDPKRVELTNFNGIPHLLAPVIVEVNEVVGALKWVTQEMDRRFKLFSSLRVRDIEAYKELPDSRQREHLPYIIVIIDELADLMMIAPNEVERLICRIAQMARATGIHLIIATQRPSVDVVTGLIKANFPSRISFAVTSQVDSRVILDTPGAEKLLGRGDMLYMASDSSQLVRLQGSYVSAKELSKLVRFWKRVAIYDLEEEEGPTPWDGMDLEDEDEADELLEQAIEVVRQHERASTSFLQRRLRIGYPRAARLMDQLEKLGIVGPAEGGGRSRPVLVDEWENE